MAIAFDQSIHEAGSTTSSAYTTASFTMGTDAKLWVVVVNESDNTDKISSVKLDDTTALTRIAASINTSPIVVYELQSTATGSHSVTIHTSSDINVNIDAMSYTGAGNSDGQATNFVNNTASTNSTTLATVGSNSWQTTVIYSQFHGPQTASSGFTVRYSASQPRWGDTNGTVSGSHTCTWTWAGGNDISNMATWNIPEASAASGPASVKTYKGVAAASVKTVKGVAIASVKTKKGVS